MYSSTSGIYISKCYVGDWFCRPTGDDERFILSRFLNIDEVVSHGRCNPVSTISVDGSDRFRMCLARSAGNFSKTTAIAFWNLPGTVFQCRCTRSGLHNRWSRMPSGSSLPRVWFQQPVPESFDVFSSSFWVLLLNYLLWKIGCKDKSKYWLVQIIMLFFWCYFLHFSKEKLYICRKLSGWWQV